MALDHRNSGRFPGGNIVPSGRIKAAQSALAQIRDAAAQGGKPHRDGFGVLRHGVTDGARHASVREGPLAAQTPAQCEDRRRAMTPEEQASSCRDCERAEYARRWARRSE